ncbi:MAG: ATP-binding protein, partial [Salegentibacter sp.]
MAIQFENEVLGAISKIYESANGSKLNPKIFESNRNELSILKDMLQLSETEAFFFAVIFTLDLEEEGVSYKSLAEYLGCNSIELANFREVLKLVTEKGYLESKKKSGHFGRRSRTEEFLVPEEVKTAILDNKLPLQLEKKEPASVVEMLEKFYKYACQCDDGEIHTIELVSLTRILLDANSHFPMVQSIQQYQLAARDITLLLYVIWKNLTGDERVEIGRSVEGLLTNTAARISYTQSLITGKNPLIKLRLLEVKKAIFLNSSDLILDEKGLELLELEGLMIREAGEDKNLLQPLKIPQKKLFFNPHELQHITMLQDALQNQKLLEIQSRLKEKQLPIGITAILHGVPGTGKTETVYQVARKTGRSIYKVEISETKSKWFGESEKMIKQVFSRYEAMMKSSEKLPILLFNEADAILSKRKDTESSSVAQTENAIQNILLEELEKFEGIFIATTNLVKNLDPAFERRFLFKIEYSKPALDIKQQIWQNRLPFLSREEALVLARQY